MLCFSDYFKNLWNYNENKNNIYCVFRIILDIYGFIMRNKYHIYCVFRIIIDTYGIIMKIKIIYIVFSDYFRHLWNYNVNRNHVYCVFRIMLYISYNDTYGIIMKIKITYIVLFVLF